jgi:hypothetical protein
MGHVKQISDAKVPLPFVCEVAGGGGGGSGLPTIDIADPLFRGNVLDRDILPSPSLGTSGGGPVPKEPKK